MPPRDVQAPGTPPVNVMVQRPRSVPRTNRVTVLVFQATAPGLSVTTPVPRCTQAANVLPSDDVLYQMEPSLPTTKRSTRSTPPTNEAAAAGPAIVIPPCDVQAPKVAPLSIEYLVHTTPPVPSTATNASVVAAAEVAPGS